MDTSGKLHALDAAGRSEQTGEVAGDDWVRFDVGELVTVKGWQFRIAVVNVDDQVVVLRPVRRKVTKREGRSRRRDRRRARERRT